MSYSLMRQGPQAHGNERMQIMPSSESFPFSAYHSTQRYTDFPIGGIGTGTVSVNAAGCFTNFELFNHPTQKGKLPYSFFAMHYELGERQDTRILEARGLPDFNQARGYHFHHVKGLPRFEQGEMRVRYPFCEVELKDEQVPLKVSMTAFNPLVPLSVHDSSIPAMVVRYRVENPTDLPAKVLVCGSLPNIYGFIGFDAHDNYRVQPGVYNRVVRQADFAGLLMNGQGLGEEHLRRADSSLLMVGENVLVQPYWYKGSWQDGITMFWKDLCRGKLDEDSRGAEGKNSHIGPDGLTVGSVGRETVIEPGNASEFTFIISWNVPNRVHGWFEEEAAGKTIKNDYAVRYEDSLAAGSDVIRRLAALQGKSEAFADALYGSTLPKEVIESVAFSLSVLRSTTCFMTEGGRFWGWEGSHEETGSCHGTCTHVWNYAQTVAFLFPKLERCARENELLIETAADGKMCFRSQQAFGQLPFDLPAAADGQLGVLVRVWREYILSGDEGFLRRVYPRVLLALDYADRIWDQDGDGLLEASQHNTYDIEFFGANPLSGVMYLAALRAVEEMARVLGDERRQSDCRMRYEKSAKALDDQCFQGEYYRQLATEPEHAYQFLNGCLSDQLLGQTMAYIAGLGDLLPRRHLEAAAQSIFKYNYSDGSQSRWCLQRLFADFDEPGLRLCSWPYRDEPALPFVYSDEVWTGVEYQVAALLIELGYLDEALTMVKAVRSRFDGIRRNPFNEMECGFHYARSMAAFGLLTAYSGLRVEPDGGLRFEPKICTDDFSCLYSDGKSWGILRQTVDGAGNIHQQKVILGRDDLS